MRYEGRHVPKARCLEFWPSFSTGLDLQRLMIAVSEPTPRYQRLCERRRLHRVLDGIGRDSDWRFVRVREQWKTLLRIRPDVDWGLHTQLALVTNQEKGTYSSTRKHVHEPHSQLYPGIHPPFRILSTPEAFCKLPYESSLWVPWMQWFVLLAWRGRIGQTSSDWHPKVDACD